MKVHKVYRITLGVTLPRDLVTEFGIAEGNELHVVRAPDGVELKPLNPEIVRALEISCETICNFPN